MKRIFILVAYVLISSSAHAQWAVYDNEVKLILDRINRVGNIADKKVTVLELNKQAAPPSRIPHGPRAPAGIAVES